MKKQEEVAMRTAFVAFSKVNRLRLKYDEARDPICVTRSRRFPHDHMYDGFNEAMGVHIERNTMRKLNFVIQTLLGMGCILKQSGDLEANLKVPYQEALKVAGYLKIIKGSAKNINNFNLNPL